MEPKTLFGHSPNCFSIVEDKLNPLAFYARMDAIDRDLFRMISPSIKTLMTIIIPVLCLLDEQRFGPLHESYCRPGECTIIRAIRRAIKGKAASA
jgi:hypothetical protein